MGNMKRNHIFLILLIATTVLYSVVNSAQSAGILQDPAGVTACSLVVAVCAASHADSGFCTTAQHRACDAMQPWPFSGLDHSGLHATFFLTLAAFFAGLAMAVLIPWRVRMRNMHISQEASFRLPVSLTHTALLAGGFSSLRF